MSDLTEQTHDRYRAALTSKLSTEFLLRHIDNVDQLMAAILAVRDVEMEQLRAPTERHAYSAMLRGMARRVREVRDGFRGPWHPNWYVEVVRLRAELAELRANGCGMTECGMVGVEHPDEENTQ